MVNMRRNWLERHCRRYTGIHQQGRAVVWDSFECESHPPQSVREDSSMVSARDQKQSKTTLSNTERESRTMIANSLRTPFNMKRYPTKFMATLTVLLRHTWKKIPYTGHPVWNLSRVNWNSSHSVRIPCLESRGSHPLTADQTRRCPHSPPSLNTAHFVAMSFHTNRSNFTLKRIEKCCPPIGTNASSVPNTQVDLDSTPSMKESLAESKSPPKSVEKHLEFHPCSCRSPVTVNASASRQSGVVALGASRLNHSSNTSVFGAANEGAHNS